MTRPSDVVVELTETRAATLIAAQFPALAPARVEFFGRGWDNTAFLVDGGIVFRFPRKPEAVPLLETEARALPLLAGRLSLEIPFPEWHGRAGVDFPWPFLGYRKVAGLNACSARLTLTERYAAAPVLGRFLARLHATSPDELDVPGDVLDRRNFAARLPLVIERLDVLRRAGSIPDPLPWLNLFSALEHQPPVQTRVLVHGDLYASHLLVDGGRRLTGVLDWGDIHAGDPAMDLMLLYGFLPAPARNAFLGEYGPVSDHVLRVARLRAAFHAISVTWYGLELGDADLEQEGRLALGFVLQD